MTGCTGLPPTPTGNEKQTYTGPLTIPFLPPGHQVLSSPRKHLSNVDKSCLRQHVIAGPFAVPAADPFSRPVNTNAVHTSHILLNQLTPTNLLVFTSDTKCHHHVGRLHE